ncbi:hypothetical protein FQP81_18080 [Pseudoalteromonas distincta]|uniref:hypothetical protein n=1 Tax=Pseudoalteromonas distincta TaxID=77608 RepID=UPI001195209A|nr:hypothetical protein [Pseudoalteromonas elyakovii]TVU70364.1 hypothetical protein FQP81_18080 [Pseudoalteromonas elyakovii]
MKLNDKDISILLSALKLLSLDGSYTSDQRRKAKELEDTIGFKYPSGCELTKPINIKLAINKSL